MVKKLNLKEVVSPNDGAKQINIHQESSYIDSSLKIINNQKTIEKRLKDLEIKFTSVKETWVDNKDKTKEIVLKEIRNDFEKVQTELNFIKTEIINISRDTTISYLHSDHFQDFIEKRVAEELAKRNVVFEESKKIEIELDINTKKFDIPKTILEPIKKENQQSLLYAESPHNGKFHKTQSNFETCETFFVIDTQMKVFNLVTDEDTLNYVFNFIDTLKPACNLLSTGAPNISNYRIEKEGTVELIDGLWTIKEKIKLNWGDSS